MSKSYIQSIKELFESDETSYNIALQTGLVPQFIDNYRVKGSKIENMSVSKAEILVNYYNEKERKLEEKTMNDYKMIEEYLENYERTTSNKMDDKFSMFKADVSALAVAYRKGEAYLYTKEEYINFLQEQIDERIEYLKEENFDQEYIEDEIEESVDNLNFVKDSKCTVFVEKSGTEGFYSY